MAIADKGSMLLTTPGNHEGDATMPSNPFLDPAAATLATVIDQLGECVPEPRRRGELASAIRTFCKVLGDGPSELPADMSLLGRLAARRCRPRSRSADRAGPTSE